MFSTKAPETSSTRGTKIQQHKRAGRRKESAGVIELEIEKISILRDIGWCVRWRR